MYVTILESIILGLARRDYEYLMHSELSILRKVEKITYMNVDMFRELI